MAPQPTVGALRHLARAERLGHRAAALHPATGGVRAPGEVQRYVVVQPADLGAAQGATIATQDIAQSRYGSAYRDTLHTVDTEGRNPQATAKRSDPLTGVATAPSSLPAFRVSERGRLAVAHLGQPKNFYAEQEAVDQTNLILRGAASPLRLTIEGEGLTVPSNPKDPESGPRPLDRVHAAEELPPDALLGARLQIADTFDALNCDDFVTLILGAATGSCRRAVLQNETERVEVSAEKGSEPVAEIAAQIAHPKPQGPRETKERIEGGGLSEEGGREAAAAYEALPPEGRQERAARLGINEFAAPDVGEGFVIRSQPTTAQLIPPQEVKEEDKVEGYTRALEELERAESGLERGRLEVSARVQRMLRTWGEHYAGVVAKDGADVVTLENYNRNTEIAWEHERIFNHLFRDFAAFRDLVADQVESLEATPSKAEIARLVALAAKAPKLKEDYANALGEAQGSFTHGLQANLDTLKRRFFFQMYGAGEQSFHSAYERTASNPLTLAIREDEGVFARSARATVDSIAGLALRMRGTIAKSQATGLRPNLLMLVSTADLAVAGCQVGLRDARSRADFLRIDERASSARRALREGVRDRLTAAYNSITGEAKTFGASGDLRDAVADYVKGYDSWTAFRRSLSWRYLPIFELNALLTALEPDMP